MQTEPSVAEVKKSPKSTGITVLLVLLLLAAIGLGVWGYLLGNNIKATVDAQAALQGKYDDLTKEKNTLATNLDQTNADLDKTRTNLEKAKKDLTTAQSDLSKSQSNVTAMRGNMDKALKYLAIVSGWFINEDRPSETGLKIKAIEDPKLTEKFEKYDKSGSEEDFKAWFGYLFTAIADLLK